MSEQREAPVHDLLRAYNGNEPYVFFSYSHENSQDAQNIIAQLIVHGYRVWFDATGIKTAEKWRDVLKQKVQGCAVFICLVSRSYTDKHWCLRELEEASESNRPIIAIYLEDVRLHGDFNDLLHSRQNVTQYFLLRPETFYQQLFGAQVLAPCRDEARIPDTMPSFAIDDRINPGVHSGNHCIIALDMMRFAYPEPLRKDIMTALDTNHQKLCSLTLNAPRLPDENSLRVIEGKAPFSFEIADNRFISVSSDEPMPEDDPEKRAQYLNHFCGIINSLFHALFQNGVTDLHLFFRGPVALLPFVGQAATSYFRIYYYQYIRDRGEYYRVGAQSQI